MQVVLAEYFEVEVRGEDGHCIKQLSRFFSRSRTDWASDIGLEKSDTCSILDHHLCILLSYQLAQDNELVKHCCIYIDQVGCTSTVDWISAKNSMSAEVLRKKGEGCAGRRDCTGSTFLVSRSGWGRRLRNRISSQLRNALARALPAVRQDLSILRFTFATLLQLALDLR